jgi:hypothetical protein
MGLLSASLMAGIDDLLWELDGFIFAFSRSLESKSLVELLRRDVLCRLSDLSSLDDDFLEDSLPRSGGGSWRRDGMSASHDRQAYEVGWRLVG